MPGYCPAQLPPLRFSLPLWKTFRSKANAIPVDSQKVFVFPQE
jgi:hypothetical protein